MKKRKILIAVLAVLAVVLLAEVGVLIWSSQSEPDASDPTTLPTESTVPTVQTTETVPEPVPTVTEPETTVPETTVPPTTVPETEAPVQTSPAIVIPPQTEDPGLSFPMAVPDSDLQIRMIRGYDGIYLEDGSDVEISGVAAILIENTGSTCVDLAKIRLTGERTIYEFQVTGLEAGASAVVMEAGKAPYVDQRYSEISADVAQTDSFERSEGILAVEDTPDGQLQITNLTDRDIPCVRIFYKFYMQDEQIYVGGITYTAKILDLKAGASIQVRPSHYAVGGSRVIMAKIYESDLE